MVTKEYDVLFYIKFTWNLKVKYYDVIFTFIINNNNIVFSIL